MRINKKITAVIAVFLLCLASFIPIFAIDAYVTVIYRKVDIAFINKSDSELNSVLSESNTDKNYYHLSADYTEEDSYTERYRYETHTRSIRRLQKQHRNAFCNIDQGHFCHAKVVPQSEDGSQQNQIPF